MAFTRSAMNGTVRKRTPVAAALANAIVDATGVRLRTVPFIAERVKAMLARLDSTRP